MERLNKFRPTRRLFGFERLHENKPDEFFELHFANLFIEVYAFVKSAFCPGDGSRPPCASPWKKEFSDEFVSYVELLARPDPRAKRWEMLLRDGTQRSPLLQAVIHKVIEVGVFSSTLFGAHPKHKRIMEASDVALLSIEGFERSDLHARMNEAYLKDSDGMPPLFWNEVDKLCTQTCSMLMPAYDYAADHKSYTPIPITTMFQLLHDIIAYAGWIHICIRTSSAIVSFDWRIPGESYNMSVANLDQEVYDASAAAAKEHERKFRRRTPDKEYMESAARVKISVAPEITRHKPMLKEKREYGMTSYTLMKPHAVFYCGYQETRDELKAFQSLPEYIHQLRGKRNRPVLPAMILAALFTGCMLVNFTPWGHQAWVLGYNGLGQLVNQLLSASADAVLE